MSIHQRHHSFSTDAITNLIIQTREVNRLRDLVRRPQAIGPKSAAEAT